MIQIRRSNERGFADHGWLKSFHSFSFADYHDPAHVSFGALRVINEDRIEPGTGFGTHGHRDMEIVSYVLAGELAHRDSLGNGSVIRPGDVQRMSAGTGVRHSEYNEAQGEQTHFLQIWILPERNGLAPGYEQVAIAPAARRGRLALIGSRAGGEGAVRIHQDLRLYAGLFDGSESATLTIESGRRVYVHVARGALDVNGQALEAGDALMATTIRELRLGEGRDAEVLVFDLA